MGNVYFDIFYIDTSMLNALMLVSSKVAENVVDFPNMIQKFAWIGINGVKLMDGRIVLA